ncbi:DUF1707 SHOCT-like domain-containing protein [Mariniluteicoccus flavus]
MSHDPQEPLAPEPRREPTNDELAAQPGGVRIGDRERDAAVERLRDHLVDGRLAQFEFDDRMARALAARTEQELDGLFTDLPGDRGLVPLADSNSGSAAVEHGGGANRNSAMARFYGIASAVSFPLALVICFATGWRAWWLILIPMMVLPALGQALGIHKGDDEDEDDGDEKKPITKG